MGKKYDSDAIKGLLVIFGIIVFIVFICFVLSDLEVLQDIGMYGILTIVLLICAVLMSASIKQMKHEQKTMTEEEIKTLRKEQWQKAKKPLAVVLITGAVILIPLVANLIGAIEGDRVKCEMCGKHSVFSHGYCKDCFNDFIDWVDSSNGKK